MADVVSVLADILAIDQVVERDNLAADLEPVLTSAVVDASLPTAVVYPQTEAELAAVVACAHRHQWRVLPCGHGSKLSWGGLVKPVDLVISTQRLNRILDHAVGDMTLTAEAGLQLSELQPVLAEHNQFLAVDPAYPHQATLGGIVSTAAAGALRQRYGGIRDMLIGISFVRYDGQLAKAGGRVVKNVAGYDLMKLMTGAYGTLGIISQLTFRLYPLPEASKTVLVSGNADVARTLAAELQQSPLTPVAADILSPTLAKQLGHQEAYLLAARFQSILPGVNEQVDKLMAMVPLEAHTEVLVEAAEAQFWDLSNALLYGEGRHAGGPQASPVVVAKVGMRPAMAVETLEAITSMLSVPYLARVHSGSGIGTLRLAAAVTPATVMDLRRLCETAGGYLTVLEAPNALKQAIDVWGYQGSALALMASIKRQFDPQQCLSAGRYLNGW
jgi:glycolate oxidase FAD binding subunit